MGKESYNSDLDVSKSNPVFGNKTPFDVKEDENKDSDDIFLDAPPAVKNDVKTSYKCFFYTTDGKLISVTRELHAKKSLDSALYLLFKGPTIQESKMGIYSEIPSNVELLSTTTSDKNIIVNLNSAFGSGGGSQSIENRLKQLSNTVRAYEPSKNIFLYIDNKEVEYLGGDGVWVKQPLE